MQSSPHVIERAELYHSNDMIHRELKYNSHFKHIHTFRYVVSQLFEWWQKISFKINRNYYRCKSYSRGAHRMDPIQLREKNNIIKFSDWVDLDHSFYDERIFQEVLRIERKRSERSGRPFLLMLIDIRNVVHSKNGKLIFREIISQLNTHTRETDIKGWYAHKSVIGITFTELGEHDRDFILERTTQRVRNCLFFIMESRFFHDMEFSLQWYPNDKSENEYEPNLLFYPDFIEKAVHRVFSLFFKRIIDIIGSITGLIIFSPLFLIIPILIKLTSRGPMFFKQERLGLFGKKFTFLKFRSMHIDNSDEIHRKFIKNLITEDNVRSAGEGTTTAESNGVYKIQCDPRVTIIGKFLRKTSLDELPQFINVLKGEMSLVGPRPPIPYECDEYKLWHMRRVIEVKPGITGLWQVEGRSSINFDEMVRLDLRYVREWSLWLDIKILLKTPWSVVVGKGAY
jgi:lipopolysaccharide/colanic/teichoic acid biosynthesis glycosyltransferase